jgi:hypothetical protein
MPKSVISASSPEPTITLAGLRSRCTTPAACAATSPRRSAAQPQRALDGRPPLPRQQRREVGPVHVGHGDVLEALDLPEVVDADDVLVRDQPGQEQLALEPALDLRRRRGSPMMSGRMSLIATSMPSSVSQAW